MLKKILHCSSKFFSNTSKEIRKNAIVIIKNVSALCYDDTDVILSKFFSKIRDVQKKELSKALEIVKTDPSRQVYLFKKAHQPNPT